MAANWVSPRAHYVFAWACTILGQSALLTLPLFVTDLIFPFTINSKPSWNKLCIVPNQPLINNFVLLTTFWVHHSVMARIPVKRVILRWLPGGMEKSVYFGSTGVVVWFMYLFWLPSTTYSLWKLQHPVLVYGVIGLGAFCWFLLKNLTDSLHKYDLSGINSATKRYKLSQDTKDKPKEKDAKVALKEKLIVDGAFKYIRHPIMTIMFMANVITPNMTLGHLMWSVGMIIYIVVAVITWEEPDLIEVFGDDYRKYMQRVPRFLPRLADLPQMLQEFFKILYKKD